MRAIQSARAIGLAGVLGACLFLAGAAHAASDTERQGSILIFAKVVNNSQRDTVIQITNTGNMVNYARCFYLNGSSCRITDFDIALTKQQPTQWRASEGRPINLIDPFGSDGAGIDPGLVPALPPGFAGALICAEVSEDGIPLPQNKLKGEATLLDITENGSNNTSEYNAITFPGGANNSDADLLLNGTEYAACSSSHQLNYYSLPDQPDPVLGGNSSVVHNLTILPCNLDLSRRDPNPFSVDFVASNEFENRISGDIDGSCWANVSLNSLNLGQPLTTFGTLDLTTDGTPVMLVSESFHTDLDSGETGSAANNVHQTGPDNTTGVIRIMVLP
jgi:hypothetical protein